jgi:hypothetical protein
MERADPDAILSTRVLADGGLLALFVRTMALAGVRMRAVRQHEATMSRWRVIPAKDDLVVTEKDYTAQFECHNVDSGAMIKLQYTQDIGGQISDVILALRATAQVLLNAANADDDEPAAGLH